MSSYTVYKNEEARSSVSCSLIIVSVRYQSQPTDHTLAHGGFPSVLATHRLLTSDVRPSTIRKLILSSQAAPTSTTFLGGSLRKYRCDWFYTHCQHGPGDSLHCVICWRTVTERCSWSICLCFRYKKTRQHLHVDTVERFAVGNIEIVVEIYCIAVGPKIK